MIDLIRRALKVTNRYRIWKSGPRHFSRDAFAGTRGILDTRVLGVEAVQSDDPNSLNVYVSETHDKGRGVFARRKILKGQVIERAPVVVIPGEQWTGMQETVLSNYAFDWGESEEHAAVALGYVSIYNHSYAPNAALEEYTGEEIIEVIALRDIEPKEEIFVNYNGEPDDREKLWFNVVESGKRNHS